MLLAQGEMVLNELTILIKNSNMDLLFTNSCYLAFFSVFILNLTYVFWFLIVAIPFFLFIYKQTVFLYRFVYVCYVLKLAEVYNFSIHHHMELLQKSADRVSVSYVGSCLHLSFASNKKN